MKPASGPPDTAPILPSLPAARLPGGGPMHSDSPSPGFFTHFVPISEAVARVVGRVRRQRERLEDEATIVARQPRVLGTTVCSAALRPVTDPEDDAVARAFAEPEIGG